MPTIFSGFAMGRHQELSAHHRGFEGSGVRNESLSATCPPSRRSLDASEGATSVRWVPLSEHSLAAADLASRNDSRQVLGSLDVNSPLPASAMKDGRTPAFQKNQKDTS